MLMRLRLVHSFIHSTLSWGLHVPLLLPHCLLLRLCRQESELLFWHLFLIKSQWLNNVDPLSPAQDGWRGKIRWTTDRTILLNLGWINVLPCELPKLEGTSFEQKAMKNRRVIETIYRFSHQFWVPLWWLFGPICPSSAQLMSVLESRGVSYVSTTTRYISF